MTFMYNIKQTIPLLVVILAIIGLLYLSSVNTPNKVEESLEEICEVSTVEVVDTDLSNEDKIQIAWDIVIQIESRGDSLAQGACDKQDQSWGISQIHTRLVRDVNRIYGTNYTHSDAFEVKKAREMFGLYLRKAINLHHCTIPVRVEELFYYWNSGAYKRFKETSYVKKACLLFN